MSTFGIEVAGEFLEIPSAVGIAYDIAGNDFAELNTRQGINSNDFNIPATVKNKRLLTGTGRIDASLYLKNRVVSIGYLQVVERDYQKKIIKIAYFGSNSDWLSLIENRNLRELNLSRFNHDYSLTNVLNGLVNSRNYCYPVINYGNLTQAENNEVNINNQDLRPALFADVVLKQIFEDVGVVVEGTLFDNEIFKRAILPWSAVGEVNPSSTFNTLSVLNTDQALPFLVVFANGLLVGADLTLGNSAYFSNGTIFNASAYGSITVNYDYSIDVILLTSNLEVKRVVRNADQSLVSENVIINTASNGNYSGSESDIEIPAGGFLQLEYRNGNTGTRVTTDVTFTCSDTKMVIGNTLPDMEQRDFVRWVVASFGCLLSFNDKTRTLTFNLSNRLYQNLEDSFNWSNRLDMSRERKENFIDLVQDYAQRNLFQYGEIDGRRSGGGSFLVNDSTLPASQDYYNAPFNATFFTNAFLGAGSTSVSLPFLDIIDEDGALSETDARILSVSISSGRTSLDITDGTTTQAVTTYNVPQFSPLSYSILIPQFYADIEKIINNKSSFEVYLRLSSSDIEQFNQENIVRIEAVDFIGYFYVTKIEDFNAEDLSYKVTLIKL